MKLNYKKKYTAGIREKISKKFTCSVKSSQSLEKRVIEKGCT